MKRLIVILSTLAVLAPLSAASADVEVITDKSDNVDLVHSEQYDGVNGTGTEPYFNAGTDLAFDGDIIVAPQQGDNGKIHLFRRLAAADAEAFGEPFRLEGTIPCFGNGQNDVAVVAPGLLAVAYHEATCGTGDDAGSGNGVSLHDISDPTAPVLLGAAHGLPGGTHTLTVHPDEPIIYASPGGIANGGGVQQIIDISDLANPTVGGTYTPNAAGCHDFSVIVREDGTFGICVGLTESQIWDLTDPFAPVTISRIVNPLIQFHHTGITTADGTLLVIGDETLAAQECVGGPTGAMFAYDISDPTLPIPQGFFAIDRNAGDNPVSAQDRTNWCTAHIFSFVGDSRTMVSSWYTGGMNLIDWSDPMQPREVGHYFMDSGDREGTVNYWSTYYHDGLVYANDRGRGALDVLAVEGLTEDGLAEADGSPVASTREGAWFSGSIAEAPVEMLAHAQLRSVLQRGNTDAMVCALAPAATGGSLAELAGAAGPVPTTASTFLR